MTRNNLEFPRTPWYMFSGRRFQLSGDVSQQLSDALAGRDTGTATIGSISADDGRIVPQTREPEIDQDPTG